MKKQNKEKRWPTTDGRYLTEAEAKAEVKELLELDLGEETMETLRQLAKLRGVTVGEVLGRLVRQAAGMAPEEKAEETGGRKRHLVIVADMPEAYGNALEYGAGRMDAWLEEALGVELEGDFDGSEWEEDVKRLYGVCSDGAREAFAVRAACFVGGEVAEKVRGMVEVATA